jgi:MFS transporter, putative metabolite:H+ symporter
MSVAKQTAGTIAARLDRLPTSHWHRKILWILGLGVLCDTLDLYVAGALLAALVASGWSNAQLNGWFISATMAGAFIGSLLTGHIGDTFGRKKSLLINLLIFGLASIASAFVTNMMQLIVLRGIVGVGLGAQLPATYGSMAEYFPVKSRGHYSGLVALIANVAPPICTVLGLLIIPTLGWRVLIGAIGVFAIAIWIVQIRYMDESPRWLASKGLFDEADAIVAKVEREVERAEGTPLIAIEQAAEPEAPQNAGFALLLQGAWLRRTIALTAGLVGMNVAIYTIVNWVPTIFVNSGLTIATSLGMTTVMLLGAPCGVWVCAKFADRVPRKPTMVALLVAISALSYLYSLQRNGAIIMAFGFVLITVLYAYSVLVCAVYVGEVFPTELRLRGVGLSNAFGRIAAVVTPPMIAWILTKYGVTAVFSFVSAVLILSAVLVATYGIETGNRSLEDINSGCGLDDDGRAFNVPVCGQR